MEAAALAATNAGMVCLAASGDSGSRDGTNLPTVDAPACCPHFIGCGGTHRPHGPNATNYETVWNNNVGGTSDEATGGGFSKMFPMPDWQINAPHGGRMVPDVAGCADPVTGYHITLNAQDIVVGGTSAVAPLWAGLVAACGRKLGFIAPKLWSNQMAFYDVTQGNNGNFMALPGPDACTGLGTPRADKIAALLMS
jgi:subtilase family serine protease